jgi:hypothetical protein
MVQRRVPRLDHCAFPPPQAPRKVHLPFCGARRPVRLNISRFDTEAHYDYLWILQLERSGLQTVLHQLSGNLSQVSHTPLLPP